MIEERTTEREILEEGTGNPIDSIKWPDVHCSLCSGAYGWDIGCDGCKLCRRVWTAEDTAKVELAEKLMGQMEEIAEKEEMELDEVHQKLAGGGNKQAMSK